MKKIFRLVFNEVIYGGHLQSLGAASIVFVSALLLDLKITWDILLVIYLIFYAIYLYNRLKEIDLDYLTNKSRTEYLKKYIKFIPVIFYLAISISLISLAIFANLGVLIFALLLLLFGVLYTSIFKNTTKKIVLFKNIYVSLFFSLMPYFLIVYYSYSLSRVVLFLSFFIFIKAFLMQILLDVKDIKTDKKQKLKTLPVLIGKEKTIRFLFILSLMLNIGIPSVLVSLNMFSNLILFLIPIFLFNFYCYYLVKKNQDFGYILQGGEFIVWLFLIIIGRII